MIPWLLWIVRVWASPLPNQYELGYISNSLLDNENNFGQQINHIRFNVRREIVNTTLNDRRRTAILVPIYPAEHRVLIEFDLGTPLQPIVAEIDFELPGFYIAEILEGRKSATDSELSRGYYFPERSRSYLPGEGNLLTEEKTWGQDDLYIGFHWMYNTRFLGIKASRSKLGLGFLDGHHRSTDALRESQTNIFKQLQKYGLTTKYAFSLWLGSGENDAKGMLILCAIDFRYAMNNFYVFPLFKGTNKEPGYFIKLEAITLLDSESRKTVIVECAVAAKLDIASGVTHLPEDILLAIYGELGQFGIDPIMPCAMLDAVKIGLVFSGVEYLIPIGDIVTQRFNNGKDCAAPFAVSTEVALGANILSALYMVFDIDRSEIGLVFARTSRQVELEEHALVSIKDSIPARLAPGYANKAINNIYDIKVRNENFTPWEKRPKPSKTTPPPTTTVTVTQEGGTPTWIWGEEYAKIMDS